MKKMQINHKCYPRKRSLVKSADKQYKIKNSIQYQKSHFPMFERGVGTKCSELNYIKSHTNGVTCTTLSFYQVNNIFINKHGQKAIFRG